MNNKTIAHSVAKILSPLLVLFATNGQAQTALQVEPGFMNLRDDARMDILPNDSTVTDPHVLTFRYTNAAGDTLILQGQDGLPEDGQAATTNPPDGIIERNEIRYLKFRGNMGVRSNIQGPHDLTVIEVKDGKFTSTNYTLINGKPVQHDDPAQYTMSAADAARTVTRSFLTKILN